MNGSRWLETKKLIKKCLRRGENYAKAASRNSAKIAPRAEQKRNKQVILRVVQLPIRKTAECN